MVNYVYEKKREVDIMHIISDGTSDGTKLYDDKGDAVTGVQAIYVLCDAKSKTVEALVKFINIPVDMVVPDANVVKSELTLEQAFEEFGEKADTGENDG